MTDWRQVEREYTDEVVGETTIPRLFFDAVERHGDSAAQLYKGGVYDRSLADSVVPEPPAGEYGSLSYEAVGDIVRRLATGFRELGVGPDDRVGIYADTRMEWCHADFAVQSAGGVVTTVYTESSPPQVQYLLEDNEAMGCVVENEELLETVLEVEDDLALEFLVVIDEGADEYADREDVYALADVHELGEVRYDADAFESWLDERDWEQLCSLVYTSGTTGPPKGVELTHENWRTALNQIRKRVGPRPDKGPEVPVLEAGMTTLSFLPLAHAFERINHFLELGSGMTIAYAESADTVGEDIQQVGPDSAASVPRVYERIYNRMREQASESPVKKRIFEWAVDVGRQYDDADDPGLLLEAKRTLADRLVYSQVREALGGNVRVFVSGGGSLSKDLAKLYRAMGLTILEGYGLTETAPVLTLNPPEDIRLGTMGIAFSEVELKIDESVVSEETKRANPGEVGELLAKGPNVTRGYWNKPRQTEEAFTENAPGSSAELRSTGRARGQESRANGRGSRADGHGSRVDGDEPRENGQGPPEDGRPPRADGDEPRADGDEPRAGGAAGESSASSDGSYFRTGDVVARDEDGYYTFVDRVKQLIVLDTGKNVAPEPIEDEFATSPRVDQIMVVGDDRKFVGAVVVPNFEELGSWAEPNDVDLPDDRETICRDERVREWIEEEIEMVNGRIADHETIKEFRLVPTEWTADNDLLTPSLKKKRRNIRDEFEAAIDDIYGEEAGTART